jgi:hypothetical protein
MIGTENGVLNVRELKLKLSVRLHSEILIPVLENVAVYKQ